MKITIETHAAAPIADVWHTFNNPNDIVQWNASDDWHTIRVLNDLTVGGKLQQRMKNTEGGEEFDVTAIYTQIEPNRRIEFRLNDGRIGDCMVCLEFIETETGVTIRQTFDSNAGSEPSEQQEREQWQDVLDRFARHAERQCGVA